jgi:hypothetical protein
VAQPAQNLIEHSQFLQRPDHTAELPLLDPNLPVNNGKITAVRGVS